MSLEVEPVRDKILGRFPCSFGLMEAQVEGLCDYLERSACNARVKDREGLIKVPQVKSFLQTELKGTGGDSLLAKNPALSPRATGHPVPGETPQRGLILYLGLPLRRVGEDREGRHIVL